LSLELDQLLNQYPLSERWKSPELFQDELAIGDLKIQRVGVFTQDTNDQLITGSAVAIGEVPLQRAYFELLERMSNFDAEKGSDSNAQARWKFSKSNGVAAHTDLSRAMQFAHMEILERDHLLRSWLGALAPEKISVESPAIPQTLWSEYEFEAYQLSARDSFWKTIGVFGFPKGNLLPNVYGFSTRHSAGLAIQKAASECLQSLAFLYDEEILPELPEFRPSPDYHQALFTRPEARVLLRKWLAGEFTQREAPEIVKKRSPDADLPTFSDLTPSHLKSRLHVVRAHVADAIPLFFGRFSDFGVKVEEDQQFHPLA
jgi:hypothetical protein